MKTNFPKLLSAFLTALMFCLLHAQAARASSGNVPVSAASGVLTVNSTTDKISAGYISGGNSAVIDGVYASADIPDLSIEDASVNEGNSGTTALTFIVSLSGASSDTVSVDYITADRTAAAPSDYQSSIGTVSFAPGETSKSITVLVNGDTEIEADETFAVNLSNAVNADIANGTGIGLIINDDTGNGCTYSISPTVLNTGAGASSGNTFTVTTQAGCSSAATTNSSFITIDSGASSSGSRTVSFSVAANSGAARTGTISVGGQTFTVNQAGISTFGLRVSITDSPDPVTFGSGQTINYAILVNNDSTATATGVMLTNNLPAGFDFVSVSTTSGTCSQSNGVVTCNLDSVIDRATVNIVARPTAPGTFTDTVSVTGNEPESNTSDNTASATTTVISQQDLSSDLRITAFNSPDVTFRSGQNISFPIFIDNDGPAPATGVVLTATLPSNVNFISGSTATGGACSFSSGLITCNIGDLPLGGTSAFITVSPTMPGTFTNVISIRSNQPDSNTSNNSVILTTVVNPAPGTVNADLQVIAFQPPPATLGGTGTIDFEVFVINNGPSPATGVILTDILPSSVTFVSATPTQGICSQTSGVITCDLGTVTGGVTISIIGRPTIVGTVTNTTSVRGNEPDFNTSNNSVVTETSVNLAPRRKKQLLSPPAAAGN